MGFKDKSRNNNSYSLRSPINFLSRLYKEINEYSKISLKFAIDQIIVYFIAFNFVAVIINFLPVPNFDGGRLIIYIIELVRGNYISPKIKLFFLTTTNIILFLVIIFIFIRDLFYFF